MTRRGALFHLRDQRNDLWYKRDMWFSLRGREPHGVADRVKGSVCERSAVRVLLKTLLSGLVRLWSEVWKTSDR